MACADCVSVLLNAEKALQSSTNIINIFLQEITPQPSMFQPLLDLFFLPPLQPFQTDIASAEGDMEEVALPAAIPDEIRYNRLSSVLKLLLAKDL